MLPYFWLQLFEVENLGERPKVSIVDFYGRQISKLRYYEWAQLVCYLRTEIVFDEDLTETELDYDFHYLTDGW